MVEGIISTRNVLCCISPIQSYNIVHTPDRVSSKTCDRLASAFPSPSIYNGGAICLSPQMNGRNVRAFPRGSIAEKKRRFSSISLFLLHLCVVLYSNLLTLLHAHGYLLSGTWSQLCLSDRRSAFCKFCVSLRKRLAIHIHQKLAILSEICTVVLDSIKTQAIKTVRSEKVILKSSLF
jgi:hypothetical protein